MRKQYIVSGPHPGTDYPEWEVREKRPADQWQFAVAYLHYQEHAEMLAAALNKKKTGAK